jgi:hypothetical protein
VLSDFEFWTLKEARTGLPESVSACRVRAGENRGSPATEEAEGDDRGRWAAEHLVQQTEKPFGSRPRVAHGGHRQPCAPGVEPDLQYLGRQVGVELGRRNRMSAWMFYTL